MRRFDEEIFDEEILNIVELLNLVKLRWKWAMMNFIQEVNFKKKKNQLKNNTGMGTSGCNLIIDTFRLEIQRNLSIHPSKK